MKLTHTPLIIGNWKMNPQSLLVATSLAKEVLKEVSRVQHVDVGIAPPSIFLESVAALTKGKKLKVVAQNVFHEGLGARTGEISLPMLKSINVAASIIGHSERRALGETNEDTNKKMLAIVKSGGTAILCVGEKERDQHGNYLSFVEQELRDALEDFPKAKLAQLVVAYEPIWAIGTGNTATPHDALEMKLFIQKLLSDLYGRPSLAKVRILYGGSVSKQNAAELLVDGHADGFLVGGASLRSAEFGEIVKIAERHVRDSI